MRSNKLHEDADEAGHEEGRRAPHTLPHPAKFVSQIRFESGDILPRFPQHRVDHFDARLVDRRDPS